MARVELRTKGKFQTMYAGSVSSARRQWKRMKREYPRFNFILVLER